MKRRFIKLTASCALTLTSSWGAYVIDTNPGNFQNPIDWCQFGCTSGLIGTPSAYTDGSGGGLVGLTGIGQDIYNLQEGATFFGNFNTTEGLLYNGPAFGNTPADIGLFFNNGQNGGGAYIQTNFFGAFTATITLYDAGFNQLASFSTSGDSEGAPEGTPLFIGAYDNTLSPSIFAMVFDAVGVGPHEPDFLIGSAILGFQGNAIPEPATLLPVGLALLGLAPLAWRRRNTLRRPG
jgi:hypothetical protein